MNSAERSLGETLLARGIVDGDQLRVARTEQAHSGLSLGRQLVRLGFVGEATLRDLLSETLGRKSVDLSQAVADPAALQLVPQEVARRLRIYPVACDTVAEYLTVATADVNDLVALDELRARLPPSIRVETRLAGEDDIARAIDRSYGHALFIDDILREIEQPGDRRTTAAPGEAAHPIVRLVDALLADAVNRDASDLHFEPEAGFLRIRYRIDGLLRPIRTLHHACWPAMAVRLKVMSGLDIAETRSAQDGACQLLLGGRTIDFRVAVQPTLHGENIVLRILDREKGIVPLDRLGIGEAQARDLQRLLDRPEGIVLVTGPTGSGKTTTLYSLLARINSGQVNIMTLEDPVEYPMPMLRQTTVADAAKTGFASGIRSLMRQDPDIILVGEIRDEETARMALRAAMTGHQVFSTLHSNSALGALPRLIDIGLSPGLLAGNLIGIVAQRLLRRLCPHCRTAAPEDSAERRLLGRESKACRPLGCARCDFQGYRGRMAIMEILRIDEALDDLIARGAPLRPMREQAVAAGFRTLTDDGLDKVSEGLTSLAELARVVNLGDRIVPCPLSSTRP